MFSLVVRRVGSLFRRQSHRPLVEWTEPHNAAVPWVPCGRCSRVRCNRRSSRRCQSVSTSAIHRADDAARHGGAMGAVRTALLCSLQPSVESSVSVRFHIGHSLSGRGCTADVPRVPCGRRSSFRYTRQHRRQSRRRLRRQSRIHIGQSARGQSCKARQCHERPADGAPTFGSAFSRVVRPAVGPSRSTFHVGHTSKRRRREMRQ